jgi:hypothetical protein
LNSKYRSIIAGVALAAISFVGCGKGEPTKPIFTNDMKKLDKPAAGEPLPQPGPTSDANEALKRMFAAYHGAKSFHLETEADVAMAFSGQGMKSHQSAIIRIQRNPDKVWMRTLDVKTGTLEFIGDGSSLHTYIGENNSYKTQTVPGGLKQQLGAIEKNTPQLFSPISILLNSEPSRLVQSARIIDSARILGKDAYVITGKVAPGAMRAFGEGTKLADEMTPVNANVKLWLSKLDYTLLQVEVDLSWKGSHKPRGSQVAIKDPAVHFIERTVAVVPNPTYTADAFEFKPPTGAKERFVERFGE